MSNIVNENGDISSIKRFYEANKCYEWKEANERRTTFKKLEILFHAMMIKELENMDHFEKQNNL